MIKSIIEDAKVSFRNGTTLTRVIMVNLGVFILINLIYAFTINVSGGQVYHGILENIAIPAEWSKLLVKPWTFFTHMFLHKGIWHFIWNMLIFYWFGRIIGDLLGDRHILPLYIYAGLFAGLVFVLSANIFGNVNAAMAMGASGAIMAFVFLAVVVAPDYRMHLLFIGPVKIKYIALAILFFDIIGSAGNVNSGGHFAHLGGAFFGWVYGALLHRGIDLSLGMNGLLAVFSQERKQKKSPLKVKHRNIVPQKKRRDEAQGPSKSHEEELNRILEKIKRQGYDKLTREEKEFLFLASKKK